MPKVTVLPHPTACPDGAEFTAPKGAVLGRALLAHGVRIEHACEFSGACGTCHVIIRSGYGSLDEMGETEEDALDRAWQPTPLSRMSCRAHLGDGDIVVEIPKYTRNLVAER